MEAIEQYRRQIDEHQKEFAELEEHLGASESEARERMAAIEVEIGASSGEREELKSRVPNKILRLYERIHARLGQAVAEAVDGRCSACNLAPPPQMYNEIMRGDTLHQCPNCKRILVYKVEQTTADEDGDASQ